MKTAPTQTAPTQTVANVGFDFAKVKSFADFQTRGRKFFADFEARAGFASKAVLFAAIFHAAQSPKASGQAVADGAAHTLGLIEATAKNYRSQVAGAIAYARSQGIVPMWDASVAETDRIAQVAAFVAKYTLRAMYDAYRAPIAAKSEDARDTKAHDLKQAQETARSDAGVTGPSALDVLGLMKAVQPFMLAASQGDANARAVLASLAAQVMIERDLWNAAPQSDTAPALLRVAS
jgi:hypothetical protein